MAWQIAADRALPYAGQMRNLLRITLQLLSVATATACFSAMGQQGAVAFKHFRTYSTGQWSQQMQAYRNGAPFGPLQKETTCASPLAASQAAGVIKLGNAAAPMCQTKVLVDEEQTAEYEQVCNTGSQQQIIHSRMLAVDDRTISTEIRQTMGGQEMSMAKITSRYVGTCPAGQSTPANVNMPLAPNATAEECAGLPAMKQQVEETATGCANSDFSESERASCKSAMQRLANEVRQMEEVCR